MTASTDQVSRAIVLWSGLGKTSYPQRDDSRVVTTFGEAAPDLIALVHELARQYYRTDAEHRFADLSDMGRAASEQFRSAHPEIGDRAVQALEWCYTFDKR